MEQGGLRKKNAGRGRGGAHQFSASNPYGKRKQGDNRQFK